jgi:ABC-type dipeptide/oligopeptide/nickel transport system ATPase subunit
MRDFLAYTKGSECPESFWKWTALSLISHIAGRKIWFNHGYIEIFPSMFIALVGSAGSGKSTAKNEASYIIRTAFKDDMKISGSVQSREDIIDIMIEDTGISWQHPTKMTWENYKPFYIIANEFESFLSVNPTNMIAFLVDIFDTGNYSKGFKKDRAEGKESDLDNPFISMLACCVPEWFMRDMRLSMFSGGLGRRIFLVIDEPKILVHEPVRPPGWEAIRDRVIAHLKEVRYMKGEMKPTAAAQTWWKEWYYRVRDPKNKPNDPILGQFFSTEHIMLRKLAMALALCEMKMEVTDEHYEVGWAMMEMLKPNILRLTSGVGRNHIAGFSVQVLEAIKSMGGFIIEKKLQALTYRDAPNGIRGYTEALQHLVDTKQIVRKVPEKPINGQYYEFICTIEGWENLQRELSK